MKTFQEFVATKSPPALGSVGNGTDIGVGSMQASNNVFADASKEQGNATKIASILKNPVGILMHKGFTSKDIPLAIQVFTHLLSNYNKKDLDVGTQAQPSQQAQPTQAQAPTQSPGQ